MGLPHAGRVWESGIVLRQKIILRDTDDRLADRPRCARVPRGSGDLGRPSHWQGWCSRTCAPGLKQLSPFENVFGAGKASKIRMRALKSFRRNTGDLGHRTELRRQSTDGAPSVRPLGNETVGVMNRTAAVKRSSLFRPFSFFRVESPSVRGSVSSKLWNENLALLCRVLHFSATEPP